jgi:acetolactate synthase-1/3 small subunit
MRHIISILLENEAGALSRVSGLFSARNYNIDSLTVAPTDDPTMSRITAVTYGEDETVQQIMMQLNKLVDVVKVIDLADNDHYEREILLVKVQPEENQLEALNEKINTLTARQLEERDGVVTLEVTNVGSKLNEALDDLQEFNVIEVVRSGAVGISSGSAVLRL